MASELVLNERLSDVILKVHHEGYSWRMPAHSLLLVHKSFLFKELLEERAQCKPPISLTLVGITPDTVQALLRYIYTDEYPNEVTTDLLIAASKYGLSELEKNLEERLMTNLDVVKACRILQELEDRKPSKQNSPLWKACRSMIERHALRVFSSDLVLQFSKRVLESLMISDRLNVPDEAVLFWGVWRWGRMHSMRNGRLLTDESVQFLIDDLLVLIRLCSLKCRSSIPEVALTRLDRCASRRTRYASPEDSLEQCAVLRTVATWGNLQGPLNGERGTLCLQIAFDRDVMLVGMTVEICAREPTEAYIRVFRESDDKELRRQRLSWCRCILSKTSIREDPETRLEDDLVFLEPLFLSPKELYSIYLHGCFDKCYLPSASSSPRDKKIEHTLVALHSDSVVAVRELHLIPDVTVSWGTRGPWA